MEPAAALTCWEGTASTGACSSKQHFNNSVAELRVHFKLALEM